MDRILQQVEDDDGEECLCSCDLSTRVNVDEESRRDDQRWAKPIDEDRQHTEHVDLADQPQFSFSLAVELLEEELLQGIDLDELDDLQDFLCDLHAGILSFQQLIVGGGRYFGKSESKQHEDQHNPQPHQ